MPSANVDLVRSIFVASERGDYSSVKWADPEIEFVVADGPSPSSKTGLAAMAEGFRGFLSAWEDYRIEAYEYRALDDERVLVLDHHGGRGKTSGLDLGKMQAKGIVLFHIGDGKVTRLIVYNDRERAFADIGLNPDGDPPD